LIEVDPAEALNQRLSVHEPMIVPNAKKTCPTIA
jgi:hypothetical protein